MNRRTFTTRRGLSTKWFKDPLKKCDVCGRLIFIKEWLGHERDELTQTMCYDGDR